MRTALRHEATLLAGGLPTLVVYVVAALVPRGDADRAASVALWSTVVLLGGVGCLAGRRGGTRGRRLAVEAGTAAAFGLVAVALDLMLH